MPILALQKRARELGRIRIGQKGPKGQPQKLDRFRVTSYSKPLIEKVAELYGGEVQPWTPQGGAPQWECITDASRIPVFVPPQPVTQWLESWTAGGCTHRCDGETNWLTGEPCDLESPEHRNAKPTTRLKVVLRDVEGVGVWRLESHGWNAAAELPDAAFFLAQVGGYVEGWLALEERVSKFEGQTRRFIVPVIDIDITPAQLLAGHGQVDPSQVEGGERKAIGTGAEPSDYVAMAERQARIQGIEGVRAVWHQAKDANHLTPDLEASLFKIGQRFNPEAQQSATTPESETQPDQDTDALWFDIMGAAGRMGMTEADLLEDFAVFGGGVLVDDATAQDMSNYLEHLKRQPPRGEQS